MFRILTKTGVENTNDDGVRDSFFNSGMRSGIVKGSLNECNLFASASNVLAIDTCELRLCGHRVVIDEVYSISLATKPQNNTRYSIVATINNTDEVKFSIDIQLSTTPLIQTNLNKTTGTYQLELGKFTLTTDGTIEDVVRTADLITGGVGNSEGNADFQIGNVVTNEIKYDLNAEVDIEKRYDAETKQTLVDITIQSPTDFSELKQELEDGLGKTINNIEKTGTSGVVDTYTITLTNGDTKTFSVTNGVSITDISKTSSSGLVDTYTISFNDNTKRTFIVKNGEKGEKGEKGDTGATGPQGEVGPQGPQGEQGVEVFQSTGTSTAGTMSQNAVTTELNNKADNTLSNVTYPAITAGETTTGTADRVIKQYMSSDGLTWYRLWASGWKECGGMVTGNKNTDITVTVPLPSGFGNTNYNVQMTNIWLSSGGHGGVWDPGGFSSRTNSTFVASFTTFSDSVPKTVSAQYYACGY